MDDDQQEQGGSSIGLVSMIETHPALAIGALVLIGAIIFGRINKNKAVGTASNLSGLQTNAQGQAIVYVPTTSSFTTINTDSNNNTGNGNTSTTNNPAPKPPLTGTPIPAQPVPKPPTITPPPAHKPAPPPAPKYGLVWGARHAVSSDDTRHGAGALAYIAAQSTNIMHSQQHAPSSVSISAGDIVKHNGGLRTNSILKVGQSVVLPSYERIS